MSSNTTGNSGTYPPSNGNSGRGAGLSVDRLEAAMGGSGIHVYAQNVHNYVFKTPGRYEVTIQQPQLPPTAVLSTQQGRMLQPATLGNGQGFNGGATVAHLSQLPSHVSGCISQRPTFGGFGVAQPSPGGRNGIFPSLMLTAPLSLGSLFANSPCPCAYCSCRRVPGGDSDDDSEMTSSE